MHKYLVCVCKTLQMNLATLIKQGHLIHGYKRRLQYYLYSTERNDRKYKLHQIFLMMIYLEEENKRRNLQLDICVFHNKP